MSLQIPLFQLAIRIEEKSPVLSHSFSYSAPNFCLVKEEDESFDNTTKPKTYLSTNLEDHRGKRTFQDLTVITFSNKILKELDHMVETGEAGDLGMDLFGFLEERPFLSGNPMVETTEGIIHVYKDCEARSLTDDTIRSELLCIFGVPAFMTISDLMSFTAPMRETIEELKIVKDGTPNQYMVLLKFAEQKDADLFYETFNNSKFNSVESEVCQIVYVSHVEAVASSVGASFPMKGLVELPNCPVCLERLDEPVQGILTILCNHSFHANCISRMTETTCPVCRYMQTPETMGDSVCAACELSENLWICLICGHVGCGRYGQKHAHRHFEETGHTFALELGKNQVWDYAEDTYVHRLVANKSDGKVVQVGGQESEQDEKKIDTMAAEFTALLSSQLESQRLFFEDQLAVMTIETREQISRLEERADVAETRLAHLTVELDETKRERTSAEKRLQQMTTTVTKLHKELLEEREMNSCLRSNQEEWRTKLQDSESRWQREVEKKNRELVDVREQVNDLMANLELRAKLEDIGKQEQLTEEQLAQSELLVTQGASSSATDAKQKKVKKKKR